MTKKDVVKPTSIKNGTTNLIEQKTFELLVEISKLTEREINEYAIDMAYHDLKNLLSDHKVIKMENNTIIIRQDKCQMICHIAIEKINKTLEKYNLMWFIDFYSGSCTVHTK